MLIKGLTRRRLLRDTAALAALWPAARLLHGSLARAQSQTAPKRLLLLHIPHGRSKPHWRPQTNPDGTLNLDFTTGGELSTLGPLQPYREQMIVLEGLDMAAAYAAQNTGHEGGTAGVFTGAGAAASNGSQSYGPSIDLLVYNHLLSQGVVMPAGLQVFGMASYSMLFHTQSGGVWNRGSDPRNYTSRYELFAGITPGEETGPDPVALRRNARRRAALDYVRERLQGMRSDLGGEERAKLDLHLDSVASLRTRFEDANIPTVTQTCTPPVRPAQTPSHWDGSQSVQLAPLQAELITQMFACDLTRVCSWMLGDSFSELHPTWLGSELNAHDHMIHGGDLTIAGTQYPGAVWTQSGLTNNCPPARQDYLNLMRWYHELVADLFSRMHAIVEENGRSLLENTLVVAIGDMGNAAQHKNTDLPVFLMGGGLFAGNRLLTFREDTGPVPPISEMVPHNRLLVSVARAFGMDVSTVGDPQFTGALDGL